ncbi:MFS general substrate transporter [Calocera cornea HHB12733]|uniref:MFS general substrate transporter n=1 Tax=Calocera cornea HHB12733 TaxID=1353952 RepID=A0A165E082_9BASI|nr:MFS general substrate transporter [Calocera cornea HHB12733]
MSAPFPTPVLESDEIEPVDEKKAYAAEAEAGVTTVAHDDKSEADTTDVDDALKIVGEQMRHFDDNSCSLTHLPLTPLVSDTLSSDKNILSYASIMGFPVTGIYYNDVAQAFYMGFIVWMFPTQYLGQKFPIAKYLGVNIILWGALVCLHAVCYNFAGFYALRFFLGMLEACVSPTLILIVSMWYKQHERASRIGWFYAGNSSTSIIGGAIAYGITNYYGPIAQWKVLYIVLGAMAIAVGFWVFFLLPDSPVNARFLTPEERIAALERVRLDQAGTHNKHIKKYQVIETFKDVRTWIMVLIILCIGIPNGGNSAFNNIITKSFGWTSQQALLLGMPGGVIAGIAVVGGGYLSDFFSDRMTAILICTLPNLIGMIIMTTMQYSGKRGVLQFASYFTSLSAPGFPLCYAWNASNMSGHTKKVTANAMTLFTFGAGSVVGTYIFLPQDAPGYISGKAAIVVLTVIMMALNVIMAWINVRMNRTKKAKLAALVAEKGWTEEDVEREREKAAFLDLTDKE